MSSCMQLPSFDQAIRDNVRLALAEDIGNGDITAQLLDKGSLAEAQVITREDMVICGRPWIDEVFRQLSAEVTIHWLADEGAQVSAGSPLFTLNGPARVLLTGERTALNFLQLLSGTATQCKKYADIVKGTEVQLLDTRKTIPGLRIAQKYAVKTGQCHNHRMGLYDAFLIKENHIAACGGIGKAIAAARRVAPTKPVEIEVESLDELHIALNHQANIIMLDNFSLDDLYTSVAINNDIGSHSKLEASGGITDQTLRPIAETGVDFISLGSLTKNCRAIDLSMRIIRM